MAKRHPLTPPEPDYGQLRPAPQHIFQSNPGRTHQQYYGLGDHSYLPSSTASYSSPAPGGRGIDELGRGYLHMGKADNGVWRQYDGHSGSTFHPYQNGMYSNLPFQQHNYPNPAMHGRGPPTPEVSDQTLAERRTPRQTRRLMPTSLSRSPSPKKNRKVKKAKSTAKKSKLDKPLSELTKHLEHVPIKDTKAWVNRSLETRRGEVGGNEYIKRPSNSFILYRSAYADRCREYEKSNNHQDISSMAGTSWAIETPEIRKQYEEWAKKERENHAAAFPEYKFQPQTQEAKARKRKGKSEDGSDEASDVEDPTYHGGRLYSPAAGRSSRNKKPRRGYRESSYTPSSASPEDFESPEPYYDLANNASYYHASNPGKPLPNAFGYLGQPSAYYQATSHPNTQFSGQVEDVRFQPVDVQTSTYGTPPPVGLPGVSHNDLIGATDLDGGHLMFNNASLDPELFAQNQSIADGGFHAPTSAHMGGFQANDYLPQHEQLEFGNEREYMDPGERWDHFDE